MPLFIIHLKPEEPIREYKRAIPLCPHFIKPKPTPEELAKIYEMEDEKDFQKRMRRYRRELKKWEKEHPGENSWAETVPGFA